MALPEEFLKQAVNIANESTITDARSLKCAIADHDLVVGVWQDSAAAHGVGLRVIRGQDQLTLIEHKNLPERLRFTAIPCRDAEEAEAMRDVFGDATRQH